MVKNKECQAEVISQKVHLHFTLTRGQASALHNALIAYAKLSPGAESVLAFLKNAFKDAGINDC